MDNLISKVSCFLTEKTPDIYKREPQVSQEWEISWNTDNMNWKKERERKFKKALYFQVTQAGNIQLKIHAIFYEKRIMILRVKNQAQRAEPWATEDYHQVVKSNWVCPVGILNFLRLVTIFFLPHSLFLNENVCTCYLMLVPQCILKAYDLFSNFTGT